MSSVYVFIFTNIISTTGFLIVSGGIFLYFLVQRNRTQARALFFATVLALLSTEILKETFHIPRPSGALIETTGYAFPSGHAMGSLFLALVVAYLVRHQTPAVRYSVWSMCTIFPLLVGLSRLQFGVHTPVQVFAGYLLGAFWAGIYVLLSRRRYISSYSS